MADGQGRSVNKESEKARRKSAKIAEADAIRDRIHERIAFLHTTQDAINEKCGFSHGFLNDFLTGRKHSMTGDAMGKLIEALETTREFLLMGDGPPTAQTKVLGSHFTPIAAVERIVGSLGPAAADSLLDPNVGSLSYLADRVLSVSSIQAFDLSIDSLDYGTGEITYRAAGDMIRKRGVVLDPEVFLASSRYAKCFVERQKIATLGKIVTLKDGYVFLAILNTASD